MKTALQNFLLSIAICGLVMFLFSFSLNNSKRDFFNNHRGLSKEEFSNEIEERDKYFFMLLRDPATNQIPPNIRERELQFAKKLEMQNKLLKISSVNSLQWKEAGPTDVGGRTRALAVDVANPNTVIAGGASGGILKSTDNGTTWHEKSRTDQLLSVTSVAQDTRAGHTNTWYYSGGEYSGSAQDAGWTAYFYGNGIYKSTDNGETWNILPNTQSSNPTSWSGNFSYTTKITVSPTTGSVFVAANAFGIFRSADGGNTFQLALGGQNEHIWSDVVATTSGTILAAISSPFQGYTAKDNPGIYKSTDDGVTWVSITPNTFPDPSERTVLGVTAANPNIVYSYTNTGNLDTNKHEIISLYKININNGSFSDRSSNLPDFSSMTSVGDVAKDEGVIHTQGNYDMAIAVKPDDENFVLIAATCLFRSTNGFSTKPNNALLDWIGGYNPTYFGYPNFHPDIHSFSFDPTNPKKMWWGCDGGLVYTDDITNTSYTDYFPWQKKNNGYDVTQFYEIDIPPAANDTRIMGGCQDNGTPFFRFDGTTTTPFLDASSGDGAYAHFGPNYAYTESQNGNLLRLHYDQSGNILPPFTNNNTFSDITPANAANQLFVNPFVTDPNDANMMYYLAGSDIWRNNQLNNIPDNANKTTVGWTDLTNFSAAQGYSMSTLAISTTPANILYYAESNTQQGVPKIFRVINANTATTGAVDISIPNAPAGAYVHNIAVNPDDANDIMIVMSNYNIVGLYHSTDGGQTYTAVEGNLQGTQQAPGPSLRGASILPTNNGTVYFAATSVGLFSTSTLNGNNTSWVQEGANVIGNVVSDYVVSRKSDGTIVVGTHGRGAFSSQVASTGSNGTLLSYDNNNPKSGVYEVMPNSNWILANRLTAPSNTVQILKLIYYIKGDHSTGTASFYPVIYSGNTFFFTVPASNPIYTGQLFKPAVGWNTIDISSSNISLPSTSGSDFFVGVQYDGQNEPVIGYDTVSNGRGWEYDPTKSTWTQLDNYAPPFPATLYIRAIVSTVTGIVDINTQVPSKFSLSQNYPNPFNPSTNIEYDLPLSEKVRLKVYDLLGNEVASLVDGMQVPGKYNVEWNGRNNKGKSLASGIYLYFFEAGNYRSTKKMILLK